MATKLGDLSDEIVVVGGLVPSLLIDQESIGQRHVGTADLDIGLSVAVFHEERYQALSDRLRQAGFAPDTNERGQPTRQRWQIYGPPKVTVDFLIPPTGPDDKPGHLKNIESDFAAVIVPGLRIALLDRQLIMLEGPTIRGERGRRAVWVCGPAAFVVMKALALHLRGENKDAYDLTYLLRFGPSLEVVAKQLTLMKDEPEVREGLGYLREAFATSDSIGPRRAAEFLLGEPNDAEEADAYGVVQDLLALVPA
ncbi:MAG: nucleotidyl transferase AbiEii/AbiGii toxin family protein [Myxococcales bacterium]|nr:nucleotidyl transferase AbiEii/AbiGii toxin family protein [Myxococcales bacterium]